MSRVEMEVDRIAISSLAIPSSMADLYFYWAANSDDVL